MFICSFPQQHIHQFVSVANEVFVQYIDKQIVNLCSSVFPTYFDYDRTWYNNYDYWLGFWKALHKKFLMLITNFITLHKWLFGGFTICLQTQEVI